MLEKYIPKFFMSGEFFSLPITPKKRKVGGAGRGKREE
jgi:hypothetical protein